MRFSVGQTELSNALSVVSKGASARSAMPVLAGVCMRTQGDDVVFQTTNLELSIEYTAHAFVEEEGSAVLPAKLFSDIVKNLPDAAVRIDVESFDASISCDNSSFSIKGLNPDDFPGFPQVSPDQRISIPFSTFSSMAKKVSRITSRDESRAILTGVLVELEGNELRMVGTDSYRLAVAKETVDVPPESEGFSAVIAGAFLSELAALPKSGEDISLGIAENQAIVSYNGTMFVNRRIEGRYPNYRQLLPDAYATRAVFDKNALVSAVKRAGVLGQTGSSVKFTIDSDAQMAVVSSIVQDVGSTQETVPAQVEGPSVEIGFNGGYVVEGLSAVEGDTVALETQSSLRPGIFKGTEDAGYLYLVMPVRLS